MTDDHTPLAELQDAKLVPIERIYLDPNNPRVGPETPPGYSDPDALFNEDVQRALEEKVRSVYDVATLEDSIMAHGWVPIDSILVWEHPDRPEHYIVVEGNTRTVALRELRGDRLTRERAKLEKLLKTPTRFAEELRVQEELVQRLESIVASTDRLRVFPVSARTSAELQATLPRLLGVRHISHSKQWGPYATNLYILSLYEKLYRARIPTGPLELVADLVGQVANMVSLGATKTRRNIQAASAFAHFRRDYTDRLPKDEEIGDEDQYFFEQILQNKYPQDQFGFANSLLRLPAESEEALFKWAFSKPRKGTEDDKENVLYKAESIRLWNQMANYDNAKGTTFAKQLNVDAPDEARPIRTIEAEYLQHKTQSSPVDALAGLLKSLHELKVDTLVSQQAHLAPMLEQIAELIQKYRKMMSAIAE